MIRNAKDYQCAAERERWEALQSMTVADSIAVGEALLTSEIMRYATVPADGQPLSLAFALRLAKEPAGGAGEER
ncbi:MAG: hypothetical protein ACKOHK_03765 [Planctomycetia bacterium]